MSFRELRSRPADSNNDSLRKIADTLAIAMGQRGHDRFNGATADTAGEWAILHAITASVVTIVREGVNETLTIIAGDRVYGKITSIVVTSGDVELYKDNG